MEELKEIHIYSQIIAITFTIVGIIFSGLWAYIVYALGKGPMPSAEFDLNIEEIGKNIEDSVVQIQYRIENKGKYPLIVSNLRTKIRYADGQKMHLELDPGRSNFAHINFPISVGRIIKTGDPSSKDKIDTSIPIIKGQTFVQPGVIQKYNFGILVPKNTAYILVKGMFDYPPNNMGPLSKSLLGVGFWLNLIPYKFDNVTEPHSSERIHCLAE